MRVGEAEEEPCSCRCWTWNSKDLRIPELAEWEGSHKDDGVQLLLVGTAAVTELQGGSMGHLDPVSCPIDEASGPSAVLCGICSCWILLNQNNSLFFPATAELGYIWEGGCDTVTDGQESKCCFLCHLHVSSSAVSCTGGGVGRWDGLPAHARAEETAEGGARCWPPHTHFSPSFLMLCDLRQTLLLQKLVPKGGSEVG